jgi:hypothetical protein
MAAKPVLDISIKPNGLISSINELILSIAPVSSKTNEFFVVSTIFAL